MSIQAELQALSAPRNVVDAGKQIDQATQAGLRAPMELVAYVRGWVTRNMGNNRYGR